MIHPYASRAYAVGLAGEEAVAVPEWETYIVRRPIAGGGCDAIGVYPLAVFGRGADLAGGLESLADAGLVSVVLVPDPLRHEPAQLRTAFSLCRPFKTHQVIDLVRGPYDPSKHHRERIRRGLRRCRMEVVQLGTVLETWRGLYAGLVTRREIAGVAAFSDAYFHALASEPALTAFAAFVEDECVGMTLWFAADGVVYNHLTASNALGYANGANFALYDTAIAHFAGQGPMNLGGGAGFSDADDGLAAFKRGFANSQVQAHLCGAILDPARYARLSGPQSTDFFPAYRAPRQA
ncbi:MULTISPECIES: GNAT family N-acetyltransferase [unclassified Phenylobacterium]|uniref:GNAT family N-acetyltransferase n=1 Tax=unclassified Phenylobacterium TaxID=2640670 RepID=UPI00083B11FD|nr:MULTISPECIES: GNAT family N-acetyltransferase [unclassified Phenylobacterium]